MNALPSWLDREEYPFASHYFDTGHGRIHYVDEGLGVPIVMTHGNPTWSFIYRNFIKALSKDYRCIAPDHLGFGLSESLHKLLISRMSYGEILSFFITFQG